MSELRDHHSGNDHGTEHNDRTDNQHWLAAYFVDDSHSRKRADEENDTSDASGQKCLSATSQTEG